MAKIRGKNEGTIHKRENGTWRAQISLEGQRLSFTGKSRRECQDWLKKVNGQIDNGLTFASSLVVLGDFLKEWLENTKASNRQATWSQYEQLIRSYVLPHLGKTKLKDLRPDHVQSLYNQLLASGTGTHTVIKIHTLLHTALEHAIRLGLVNRNVTNATIPPKEPAKEMKILDESQISQLLVAAIGTRLEAILYFAVTTGMRQMELLGLKWSDLDWSKQTIKVERQLVRPDRGEAQFSQPKTRNGRRTVALGDRTIAVLRKHYDVQFQERKQAGERWTDHGLVFATKFGTPIHPRNLLRDFKILLKEAGLPEIRFHDLRHTAASLMLNHNIPVIVVSRRLGHAKPSITLDIYGHLIPSMQAEVAQKIDDLVSPVALNHLHPTAPNCTRSAPDLLENRVRE
jgi:integrase